MRQVVTSSRSFREFRENQEIPVCVRFEVMDPFERAEESSDAALLMLAATLERNIRTEERQLFVVAENRR